LPQILTVLYLAFVMVSTPHPAFPDWATPAATR
jgi:hypothetical protein